MLKKRVIFALLFEKNHFVLSRNFNLQRFGDFNWLSNNYNFKKITFSIDELLIINVNRNNKNFDKFFTYLKKINRISFIPLCAGGGINTYDIAQETLNSGADKIIVNSLIYNNPSLIDKIAKSYGAQSIIASIDVKKKKNKYSVFIDNGKKEIPYSLKEWLEFIQTLKIGEIYLNSIDKDGSGNGYDFDILKCLPKKFNIPVIFAGGAGNYLHLLEGLKNKKIDAVSTANLINFIGDGLINARKKLLKNNIKLAIRND